MLRRFLPPRSVKKSLPRPERAGESAYSTQETEHLRFLWGRPLACQAIFSQTLRGAAGENRASTQDLVAHFGFQLPLWPEYYVNTRAKLNVANALTGSERVARTFIADDPARDQAGNLAADHAATE